MADDSARPAGRPARERGIAAWAQTTLRIPRATLDRLNAEAERRVVGRSLIVRAALEAWLDEHEGD